jgi:hypothetical protein
MTLARKLTGKRRGALVALHPTEKRTSGKKIIWVCLCDCGKLFETGDFSSAHGPKSCGCSRGRRPASTYAVLHGESIKGKRTAEYLAWKAIRIRCRPDFPGYGARGITMSPEWTASYEAFLSDMGRRPSLKHSIDRIDVNGNYCAENCRWATTTEQARNKRNTRRAKVNGVLLNVPEISQQLNISQGTIHEWIKAVGDGGDITERIAKHRRMPQRGQASKSSLTSEACPSAFVASS